MRKIIAYKNAKLRHREGLYDIVTEGEKIIGIAKDSEEGWYVSHMWNPISILTMCIQRIFRQRKRHPELCSRRLKNGPAQSISYPKKILRKEHIKEY